MNTGTSSGWGSRSGSAASAWPSSGFGLWTARPATPPSAGPANAIDRQSSTWRRLRDAFRAGMNPEIRAAIEELEVPSKLERNVEVSYPRVAGQRGEEELYQWFASNDQQRDDALKAALQPVAKSDKAKIDARIPKPPRLRPPRT